MLKTFILQNTWLQGMEHGFGNGYVVLPEGHKYNGVDYDDIPVEVHGGLTFGRKVGNLVSKEFALFIKGLNPEDYIVGFDTAHLGDTQEEWGAYEVAMETHKLSAQLSQF